MTLTKRESVPTNRRHAFALLAVGAFALVVASYLSSEKAPVGVPARALLVGTGLSGSPPGTSPTGGTVAARQKTGTFRIAGSAAGLYPGHTVPLVLTVTNPESFAIVVTSLTVKVSNASTKCTAGNLSATAFDGKLTVPAHRSARATLHLSMHLSARNGCEGAKFPLTFRGLAGKA